MSPQEIKEILHKVDVGPDVLDKETLSNALSTILPYISHDWSMISRIMLNQNFELKLHF